MSAPASRRPAGDVEPPPAREGRPTPADWEAAPGLATWCRASAADGLRRGVRRRVVESCRLAALAALDSKFAMNVLGYRPHAVDGIRSKTAIERESGWL